MIEILSDFQMFIKSYRYQINPDIAPQNAIIPLFIYSDVHLDKLNEIRGVIWLKICYFEPSYI